ncbi:HNH endonuclease [Rhodococcus rhodochrous]|uniref:HNH endonuclease n=1 Tax=Rhodococcus rhodochrous TaxID=1829 RepID=UPI0024B8B8D8|nr:HNH endonuclease [Rhodococcus rhodochrous]MDJ0401738.1 HNH endonuclease [Rhodococcus rhodochrous]
MRDVRERFWEKVSEPDERGCRNWTASLLTNGGGGFFVDGKMLPAGRVAYELEVGPIPAGMRVARRCRNKLCVNPRHLVVTDYRGLGLIYRAHNEKKRNAA